MELEKKVALVTGGSLWIGRSTVLLLAREGADDAFTYLGLRHQRDEPNSIVSEIQKLGGRCLAIETDVSRYKEAEEVVRMVVNELGGLHILANNAGIT